MSDLEWKDIPVIATKLTGQCRRNAKKRDIDFALSSDSVMGMLLKSNGRCVLTGIEFDFSPSSGERRPWYPSIDRIDSSQGYSAENCRIICVAANLAMNEWGEDVLLKLSQGYMSKCRRSDHLLRLIEE